MNALASFLLISGLVLGLGPAPALAQGCGPGCCAGPGRGMGRNADWDRPCFAGQGRAACRALGFLDLSAEQRTKADALLERHRTTMDARFKDLDAARKALGDAQADPAADAARIKAAYGRMADAQAAIALARRSLDQDLGALLTPEQKKAWEARRGFRGCRGAGGCGAGWRGGY